MLCHSSIFFNYKLFLFQIIIIIIDKSIEVVAFENLTLNL